MARDRSEQPAPPAYTAALDPGDLDRRLKAMFPDGLPNVYRMLSRNARVMAGLVAMKEQLAGGVLTEAERTLIALEVARHSDCRYCMSALSHHGQNALGMSRPLVEAALTGAPTGDARLDLLTDATRALLDSRGKLGRAAQTQMAERGLRFDEMLEIVAVIGEYTVATFAANLDRTRIDPEYRMR